MTTRLTPEFREAAAKCRTVDDWQPLFAGVLGDERKEVTPERESEIARDSLFLAQLKVGIEAEWERYLGMDAAGREAYDRENLKAIRDGYRVRGEPVPSCLIGL